MALVKLNNRGVRSATTFGSITGLGSMVFIKKQTASSSSTISFVDGTSDVVLDNTYKEYLFTFNNMHPATDGADFSVNFRDGGSSYDATKTTTAHRAYHDEGTEGEALEYETGRDLAQSTSAQALSTSTGNDNDQSLSGWLRLFNPSDTTYVKHFIAQVSTYSGDNYNYNNFTAGYCNVTAAIDAVQFTFSSGNIDAGDICLYGIN
jgi:hypothetical protein